MLGLRWADGGGLSENSSRDQIPVKRARWKTESLTNVEISKHS